MKRGLLACLAAIVALGSSMALAQDFPTRPVKIIVPFPAGGSADVLPRIVAAKIGDAWKPGVIIENKTGAAGNIGAEAVYNAAPDGYTLMSAPPPPIAINQNLYPKLNYDPTKFKPITVLAASPNVVAVSKKLGVSTVQELIAKAKANPGALRAATQGNGSTSHLTMALFESMAGVKFINVPYRGTAPALNDLISGEVDLFFDNISSSLPQHKGGSLKIIAVCSPERDPALPDVPTVSEAALKGFSAITWFAMMAPPGTPDAIVDKINRDVVSVLRSDDVKKLFQAQSATPIGGTPAETAAFIARETKLWGDVIKQANVKLDE